MRKLLFFFFLLMVPLYVAYRSREEKKVSIAEESFRLTKGRIGHILGESIKENKFPETIELPVDGKKVQSQVEYTVDPELNERARKILESYKPDHAAFVAIDATDGRILSMLSYSRENPQVENMTVKAQFPAASVFKVVTAAAAVDVRRLSSGTIIPFNGRKHTLYKKNVEDTKRNRWTNYMTIREAFGSSVNTVFAKLGVFYVGPKTLLEYAERFKFNNAVPADIPVERGVAQIPLDDEWAVAEAASGFTLNSTMSPLQGALIAASVANDGVMMQPYVIDRVLGEDGSPLYEGVPTQLSVTMTPKSASELRVMMRETIIRGTSRKSFKQVAGLKKFDDIEIGGKTGSLTGLNPRGKCDWFVGYLIQGDKKIAVAALTINEEKWRVKSSYLAGRYFEDYLKFGEESSREVAAAAKDPSTPVGN